MPTLTKNEVDQMDPRQRLWAGLKFGYDQKIDSSNQDFARAYSQAHNQMLSRGMQRSSYGAQTLANLGTRQVEAANAIRSEQIADYANRLYQLERDEVADQQWEQQFNESVRQFNLLHPQGGSGGGGSSSGGTRRRRTTNAAGDTGDADETTPTDSYLSDLASSLLNSGGTTSGPVGVRQIRSGNEGGVTQNTANPYNRRVLRTR